VTSYGLSPKYLSKGALDAEKSISEALKGYPVLVENAATDKSIQYRAEAREEGIVSILSIPMLIRGQVMGVLRLYTSRPRIFTDNELALISAIAEIGAIAIDNATFFESKASALSKLLERCGVEYEHKPLVEKNRIKAVPIGKIAPDKSYYYFSTLHQLTRTIVAHMEMNKTLETVVKEITKSMRVKGCCLLWLNTLTQELELVATYGLSQTYLSKGPLKMDKSIPQALEGETVLIANASKDPRIQYPEAAKKEGINSILSVPIFIKEKVRGVLRLYSSNPTPFVPEEIEFARALAEIGGIAIFNATLYQEKNNDLAFWQSTLNYLGIKDPQNTTQT
jgi:signal transduction protein with GAF and PtsI domain